MELLADLASSNADDGPVTSTYSESARPPPPPVRVCCRLVLTSHRLPATESLDARECVEELMATTAAAAAGVKAYLRAVFATAVVPPTAGMSDLLRARESMVLGPRPMVGLARASTVALYPLPTRFDTLYAKSVRRSCSQCNSVPDSSAICLVCGAFICAGESPCKSRHGGMGPCTAHAAKCGDGVGIFLLVHSSAVSPATSHTPTPTPRRAHAQARLQHNTTSPALTQLVCAAWMAQVVVVRGPWAAYYASPYVDHHGEQDCGFRRGLPLSLSEERYSALAAMWASHKVSVEVAQARNTKDRVIRLRWY